MDYFFQRVFRGVKSMFGVVGALSSITIIALGAMGIQTIAIPICGGICLIPVGFIFFENTKVVRDMEKYVSQFKIENNVLKQTNLELKQTKLELDQSVQVLVSNNSNLTIIKDELILANEKYESMLEQTSKKLEEMAQLVNQYKTTAEQMEKNLTNITQHRDELKQQATQLLAIKDMFEQENKKLNENISLVEEQLKLVTTTNLNYEKQLQDLKSTSTLLKDELERTRRSYEEAKASLKSLLQATGVLTDLGNEMIKVEHKTESNVDTMTKILNMFGRERAMELFAKYDIDGNKVLTLDEYLNLVLQN